MSCLKYPYLFSVNEYTFLCYLLKLYILPFTSGSVSHMELLCMVSGKAQDSLYYLISVERTSVIMLNRSGDNGHLFLFVILHH